MSEKEFNAKEAQEKSFETKEKAARNEEIDAKMKELGLKPPRYVRGMMEDLGEINICFLE